MSVNVDISGYDVDAVCGVLTNIGFFVSGDKTKQPNAILFGGDFNCGLIFSNSKKTSLLDFLIKDVFLETIVHAVAKQLELSLNQLSLEIGFSKNYLSRAINNNYITLDTERKIFEKLLNLLKPDASGGLGLVEHVGTSLDNVALIECGELNNLRSANAELETINDEYVDIITYQELERSQLGDFLEKATEAYEVETRAQIATQDKISDKLAEKIKENNVLGDKLKSSYMISFVLLLVCACLGLALGVAK